MAGAWARKKSQEVPIQGTIVNDETMESETDKTLTINAIKRLTHGSNILCNGDFQINQREDSEYTMNKNSAKYTIDMWFIYADSNSAIKVSNIVNGIRIETSGGMTQFQQKFDNLSGRFTISAKISLLSGNVKVSIYDDANWNDVKTDLKVGVNNVSFEKESFNRLAFRFTGTCVLEVEYIDLFKGSIAYSHVKEDYAIALTRCMRFVQLINYSITHNAVSNAFVNYSTVCLPMPMANTPTIEYKQQSESTNVSTLTEGYLSGNITVQIVAKMSGAVRIIGRTILLSCEPL